jgi:hypothetical protein
LSEEKFLPSGAKIVSGDAGNLFSKPASQLSQRNVDLAIKEEYSY